MVKFVKRLETAFEQKENGTVGLPHGAASDLRCRYLLGG